MATRHLSPFANLVLLPYCLLPIFLVGCNIVINWGDKNVQKHEKYFILIFILLNTIQIHALQALKF